ncbi:MAG TPA: ribonuclease HII [Actinomycetota bacterium]|nr:ribonuclease HII [Actinomycetota bacterium]
MARVDRLKEITHYERMLRSRGFGVLAGVDEAGRGALAGPLVAAAVILPEDFDTEGLEDSKVLTPLQRARLFERISAEARAVSICRALPTRIDRNGLHRTNVALLRRALKGLGETPDYVLADGFPIKGLGLPTLGLRKGDAITASVAAASIVAKVTRDRIMDRYHRRFPDYGFDTNRGYGTRRHWAALDSLGPSPIHRRSFKGVAHPRGWDPSGDPGPAVSLGE